MNTPWGQSQSKEKVAYGINWYFTAGHGGIKVSDKKNLKIPEYMRNPDGWYEEDCEWAKVAVWFRWEFQDDMFDKALSCLKEWNPDSYEALFGVTIPEGESGTKDRRLFKKRNHDNYTVKWAVGSSNDNAVPEGWVGVGFYRESDGSRIEKLIPKEAYYPRYVIESKFVDSYEDMRAYCD